MTEIWKSYKSKFYCDEFIELELKNRTSLKRTDYFAYLSENTWVGKDEKPVRNPFKGHSAGSMRESRLYKRECPVTRMNQIHQNKSIKFPTIVRDDGHRGLKADVAKWAKRTAINLFYYPWAYPEEGTPKDLFVVEGSAQALRERVRDMAKNRPEELNPVYLNPVWGEWLMGWCLGWTDLKPLESI